MTQPLDPRTKRERELQALKDRRRVLDRQIWATEQEIAAQADPPRRRATDRAEPRDEAGA